MVGPPASQHTPPCQSSAALAVEMSFLKADTDEAEFSRPELVSDDLMAVSESTNNIVRERLYTC